MRLLLPLLMLACPTGAAAQDGVAPTGRPCVLRGDMNAFVESPRTDLLAQFAADERIDFFVPQSRILVRDGELSVCLRTAECWAVGEVARVLGGSAGTPGRPEEWSIDVVPTRAPGRIERWAVRFPVAGSPEAWVAGRGRYRPFDSARTPGYARHPLDREHSHARSPRRWAPAIDGDARRVYATLSAKWPYDPTRFQAAGVTSVAAEDRRVVRVEWGSTVFVLRDRTGRSWQSCAVFQDTPVPTTLEDAVPSGPLGRAFGAAVVRLVQHSQGYEYDLGKSVELMSLVPGPDGLLALSVIGLGGWDGEAIEDPMRPGYDEEYRGRHRTFRIADAHTAVLSSPREHHALAGYQRPLRIRRVRAHFEPAVIVRFDKLGFLPPPPPPPAPEPYTG